MPKGSEDPLSREPQEFLNREGIDLRSGFYSQIIFTADALDLAWPRNIDNIDLGQWSQGRTISVSQAGPLLYQDKPTVASMGPISASAILPQSEFGMGRVIGPLFTSASLSGSGAGIGSVIGPISAPAILPQSGAGIGRAIGPISASAILPQSEAGIGRVTGPIFTSASLSGSGAGIGSVMAALPGAEGRIISGIPESAGRLGTGHRAGEVVGDVPVADKEALVRYRAKLLADYKADTGVKTDYAIYDCAGPGTHSCYRREFRKWKKGILRPDSVTCENLERFLKERRKPPKR